MYDSMYVYLDPPPTSNKMLNGFPHGMKPSAWRVARTRVIQGSPWTEAVPGGAKRSWGPRPRG